VEIMMREKVLTVLLIISLCANAYLIFFNHSTLDRRVQGIVSPILFPASGIENNSSTGSPVLEEDPSETTEPVPDETIRELSTPQATPEETMEATSGPTPEVTVEETPEPTPAPDAWINYTNTKNKFSLQYPPSWNISETSTGSSGRVLVLTAPVERECPQESTQCYEYIASMTIVIDPNPGTPNPEDYFTIAVAALQEKYSITSTSKSASCLLSGVRAYQIEFFTRDERGNPERSYMQYYGLFDGKAYIISYTGPYSTGENVYSHNKADAQRIIDSFVVDRTYTVV
jgi:hypothetical protein